jgi:hypothetical protein
VTRLLWWEHRRMLRKRRPPLRLATLIGVVILVFAALTALVDAWEPSVAWLLASVGVLAVLLPRCIEASIYVAAPDNPYMVMLTTGHADMDRIDRATIGARIDEVWTSRLGPSAAAAYRECMVVLSRIVIQSTVVLAGGDFGLWLIAIPVGGAIRWAGIAVCLLSTAMFFLRYRPRGPRTTAQVAAAWDKIAHAAGWSTITSTPPASPERFQEWLEQQLQRAEGTS